MHINIWGLTFENNFLDETQEKYISSLPKELPSVEWIWSEMDRVWDEYGLDNSEPLSTQDVGAFYGHPVWIINGLFTEIDLVSKNHRQAISDYLKQKKSKKIADYGGGSGVLSSTISNHSPNTTIDIIEPYASIFFKEKIKKDMKNASISFEDNYTTNNYDAIIAQDVLEHIENPIEVAYNMASHIREGGLVIFANCFYPVIKCHLPRQFYLRHTFQFIMKKMGLEFVGRIKGAEHAIVFKKNSTLNLDRALAFAEKMKLIGDTLNFVFALLSRTKKTLK